MTFSVVICVYANDNPQHFSIAIESIFNQTVPPNEIILVVDGPIPDSIANIIKVYDSNSKIIVIRIPNNLGHGNARRIGLENCTNELVALMDADDISVPDRFEKQIVCFNRDNNLSIVGGNIREFVNSPENVVGIREVPQSDKEIKEYMKKRCPFNQMTVMFKRTEVEKAGGYLDWYCDEDYYLWIRMFQKGAVFRNLSDCLVLARVGQDMYRRRGGWKYFRSETRLQRYMYKNNIIGIYTFIVNVIIRLIIQVFMPNYIRGFIFKRFARKRELYHIN